MSETQPLPESGQDRPCRSSFGACNEGRASRPVNGSLVLTRAPAGRSVLPLRGAAVSAPAGVADARPASSQRGRARSRGREHVPSRVRSLGVHSSRRSDGPEGVVQAAASVGEGAGSTVRGRRRDRVKRRLQETLVTAGASPSWAGPTLRWLLRARGVAHGEKRGRAREGRDAAERLEFCPGGRV